MALTRWYKKGGDPERAKQLFEEAGYAGPKVIILSLRTVLGAPIARSFWLLTLGDIGGNTELTPRDWAALVDRRSNTGPVDNGGWSIYPTIEIDFCFGSPLSSESMAMDGTGMAGPRMTNTRRFETMGG